MQIVGFAHDEKSDGGKAGITFIFKDCIGEHVMNSTPTNEGGWEKSEMRSYLNSEGLDLLPNDLKQEVVAVNKLTDNEGCSSQGFARSASPVTVTSDQLWLFSAVELSGTNNTEKAYSIPENETAIGAEGSEYKLFSDMNVDREDFEIEILQKSYQGSLCSWAGRTPFLNESSPFLGVNARGVPLLSLARMSPAVLFPASAYKRS